MKNTPSECVRRNQEFIELYRSSLAFMVHNRVRDARRRAVEFTLNYGRPHYPVSFERAYPVVCSILKKHHNPCKRPYKRMMWFEIADRVRVLVATGDISIAKALEHVLTDCRASRFFIEPNYAYHLVLKLEREDRERRVNYFRRQMLNRATS